MNRNRDAQNKRLSELTKNQWDVVEEKLHRKFTFDSFNEAVGFVNKVADVAEEENHHPRIILDYDTVEIYLITHEENKITIKDIILAEKINKLVPFP